VILFVFINCNYEGPEGQIPLLIHQTWKTKDIQNPNFIEGVESWKTLNPEFIHTLYDDVDCLQFIKTEYPQYLSLYNSLELPVQKADIFRYLIIHKYGGVYTDIDTKCLKGIRETLDAPTVVGIEYLPEHNKGKTQIIQWFFASVPGNPVFIKMVDEIMYRKWWMDTFGISLMLILDGRNISKSEETLWLTGPYVFSDYILKIPKQSIHVYPRCTFGSYDTTEKCRSKGYLIHGFEGSWKKNWGDSNKRY
jgi:mannosyltransferase OCH1-like enzyme